MIAAVAAIPLAVKRHAAVAAPTEIVVKAEGMPAMPATAPSARLLRVCADPNNLPFSNEQGEGFENKIAELMARRLGRQLQYDWHPQRRGFIRTTLRAGTCDLVVGVLGGPTSSSSPSSSSASSSGTAESGSAILTTHAYYRSTYVFVSRRDRHLGVTSFDDPRLRHWRIGIQLTGDDYGNPPPAQALASRRIVQNIRGYTVYGDYSRPDPQRSIVDAVRDGAVDVAVLWGPVGGYFAHQPPAALDVSPVTPLQHGPEVPLAFSISMAVRSGDAQLAAALNSLIARDHEDIRRILDGYHVPLVAEKSGPL